MNRPFVVVVLAYAAGLLLAEVFHPPLFALFVAAFLCLLPTIVLAKFRLMFLWPLLLLTGWINVSLRTDLIGPNDLRILAGTQPAMVTVRGRLAETPRLRITEFDGKKVEHSVVPVQASEVLGKTNYFWVSGEVMINTPGMLGPGYFAGQPIEVSGVLAPPPGLLFEGSFDYRQYLAEHGIFEQLKTDSTADWRISAPPIATPPLTDRFLDWARNTLSIGLPMVDQPLELLWAMTLGWRTAFVGDVGDPFLRAGTMHMFAIDGLRIALLSGIIVTFLRVLRLSRGWCGVIAVPMIWFYTAATGWQPPAVRASVMMTIVLGGWSIKRPGDLLNSLALAAFIILVQEPRQLFDAGFQLSFFVVLVIALMLPKLNALIDRLVRHDPLLPDELLPGWQARLLADARWVARYAALSFAAWVGSAPLAAKYFHLFSPVSTLANIFAVPCGTLALIANFAALICGTWFPWATALFNHAAWFFMVAMTWISETATKIPGAYFYVQEPPTIWIAIYYAVLLAILSGWFATRGRKIFGVIVALCIAIAGLVCWLPSRSEIDLTVLPLNGGHAVYVDAAGQKNDWLVDCGSKEAVDFTLKTFLHDHGVNRLPRLVLTEGEAQNCGGAELLDELFSVGELWTSGVKFRSDDYRAAVAHFELPPPRHQVMVLDQAYGNWRVLHPEPSATSARADDNALVLLGNFSGTRILLLSDLSREGQSALLSRTNDLKADIVIAGLPEKGEPLCDALLAAMHPKLIVIADSDKPATRRASKALMQRLAQSGVPVIYTREAGAVTIVTQSGGWVVGNLAGQKFSSMQVAVPEKFLVKDASH